MSVAAAKSAQQYRDALEDVAKYLAEWASVFQSQGLSDVAEDMYRKAAEVGTVLKD